MTPSKIRDAGKGAFGDGLGLWLMKDSKTTGRWSFRYQLHKKSHEMGLGSFRTFTVAEAREEALALRKLVKKGIDPLADRRASVLKKKLEDAAAVTFEDFAREYISNHRAGWSNAKSEAQWRQSLETYAFPVIGSLSIADVDVEAVKRILLQPIDGVPFWSARPETASRVRSRIEKVLGAAAMSGKRGAGDNPARWRGHLEHVFVPRSKAEKGQKRHHAALPYAQVPAFLEALRKRDGIAALALEFCILTAARVGEVRMAVWDEVDLPNKVWTVPASRMKTREAHEVPLSNRAVEILKAIRGEGDGFVFPGRGAPVSDKSIREALTGIMPGFTTHGFRSSFRTWCAEATEFPREVAEMALGHRVGSAVEEAYRRTRLFERRRKLMDTWSEYCGGTTGTVLEFVRTA